MGKLICVIGVTGNQGGSVAQRFLQDSNYRVRGITRNPDSPAAQKLATQGIEIVKADLDDVDSLIAAFEGANAIFSVTNYWSVALLRSKCQGTAIQLACFNSTSLTNILIHQGALLPTRLPSKSCRIRYIM